MASNLGFIANFRDVKRPVCVITSPAVNLKMTNLVITAAGKASDNVGVSMSGINWTAQGGAPRPSPLMEQTGLPRI